MAELDNLRALPVRPPEDLPDRVLRRIAVQDSGCWLWAGGKSTDGYGRVWWEGETRGAHRLMYTLLVGTIPTGLHIDHLCRQRACVNPAHLEPVTCRENLLRGETLQAANAAKTHCQHGHPLSGENVYENAGRRHCRACRRRLREARS